MTAYCTLRSTENTAVLDCYRRDKEALTRTSSDQQRSLPKVVVRQRAAQKLETHQIHVDRQDTVEQRKMNSVIQ